MLSQIGETHAADKSFNNHWGVPLTLARMPASARFGVFEIGMNHAGEITPLTQMVRPHVAIITTVEPVHLAQFNSVEEIAAAKAEIFLGLEPGAWRSSIGTIRILSFWRSVQPRRVRAWCRSDSMRGRTSGRSASSSNTTALDIEVELGGHRIAYKVGVPGAHIARNSLAVAAAVASLGMDAAKALEALGGLAPPPGRGARAELAIQGGTALLIDESYNANPASMRAALAGARHGAAAAFPAPYRRHGRHAGARSGGSRAAFRPQGGC